MEQEKAVPARALAVAWGGGLVRWMMSDRGWLKCGSGCCGAVVSMVEVLVVVLALAAVVVVGGDTMGVGDRSISEVMGPMVVCSGWFEFPGVLGSLVTGAVATGMLELGGRSSRGVSSSTAVVVRGGMCLGCLELPRVVRFLARGGGSAGPVCGADSVSELFSNSEMVANGICNSGCLEFAPIVRCEVSSGTHVKLSTALLVERFVAVEGSAGGLSDFSLASGSLRAGIVFSRWLELPRLVRFVRPLDGSVGRS